MRKIVKRLLSQTRRSLGLTDIANDLHALRDIATQQFISNELSTNTRYANKLHLNRYEYKVFSQFGEDGIIAEIFKRIGVTNRYFVEIGAEDGRENNSLYLLAQGWDGCWIEANQQHTASVNKNFNHLITTHRLNVINEFVTTKNINPLFKTAKIPETFDFLSIDIDGNDYWILQALDKYTPRVICAEYNALVGSQTDWVMPYNPNYIFNGSTLFGASLLALDKLLSKKGYILVACSLAGNNAFFVKKSLAKNKFLNPFTPDTFFQPQRFFLYQQPPYLISDDFLQSIGTNIKQR